jgi:HEAT repeat protein
MGAENDPDDRYQPQSDFLCSVIAGDVPLVGSDFADENLRRLIAFTTDADFSNRDWAVLLLAQQEIDRPDVRSALLRAAQVEEGIVRAQAVWGLALIDPQSALPFVQQGLKEAEVFYDIIEAAGVIAHPSLIDDLIKLLGRPGDDHCDYLARSALVECQRIAHSARLNQSD